MTLSELLGGMVKVQGISCTTLLLRTVFFVGVCVGVAGDFLWVTLTDLLIFRRKSISLENWELSMILWCFVAVPYSLSEKKVQTQGSGAVEGGWGGLRSCFSWVKALFLQRDVRSCTERNKKLCSYFWYGCFYPPVSLMCFDWQLLEEGL